jgi:6-pyruvoyltetrahydropterin/6-carboxytetrahydropterin synthase
MHTIVKRLHFCYGHRLLDYNGKCARPHGHNGVVEVELWSATLDERGMIFDFTDVKTQLGDFIDTQLDHRMLLRKDDPLVPALQQLGEEPYLMNENPTAENISKLIYSAAHSRELPVVAVRLWETHDSFAEYRKGSLTRGLEP